MTFLAVIASTGLGMEEFISPTVLVDIAICGERECMAVDFISNPPSSQCTQQLTYAWESAREI